VLPLNIDYAEVVAAADIEKNNDYCREYILDWSLESDDYMSWFEKSQLEYDGVIACKEPRIDYNELVVSMILARETTVWESELQPNHTYLMSDGMTKIYGYFKFHNPKGVY